jgi:hypothetical protein
MFGINKMTTFGESYKEMSHRGSEGRFLDIRDPTERFELHLSNIEFIDPGTIRRLLGLAQTIKNYGMLNPYAYAIGFSAVDNDPRTGKMSITKDSLDRSYKLLDKKNHDDIWLYKLIDKSDIVRYARLYIRVQTIAIDEGKNEQVLEAVDEGYEDENAFMDDEENYDYEGDGYGGGFDGDDDDYD